MRERDNRRKTEMGKSAVQIVIIILSSIIIMSIVIGALSYFTGLNIGQMIVTGFKQLKYAFGALS